MTGSLLASFAWQGVESFGDLSVPARRAPDEPQATENLAPMGIGAATVARVADNCNPP